MKRTVFITGATSGIGEAIAILFAKTGFNVIITGRRKERLIELEEKLKKETQSKILTLAFDVRSNEQVCKAIDNIPEEWKNIDILVNNAGLASGLDPIQSGDIEDWEKMIDTNVKGLLYVTRKIAPIMINRNSGHIINIGSIAGKEVYPNGNVYCATKHAVDALTKAMRIDMLPHNIKVTQIAPGMIDTEFSTVRFHGDKDRADKVYDGLIPLCANDVADIALFVVTRPEHVCLNDIIVTPTAQATGSIVVRK
jgi:NADP-dependent 3-hydroxy acid dehydrogenase YdfG